MERYQRALDMMLTQRGGDALGEVERVLAVDPKSVIGHCLRAALIVRADPRSSCGRTMPPCDRCSQRVLPRSKHRTPTSVPLRIVTLLLHEHG